MDVYPNWYRSSEVTTAPSAAGLYAWYAVPVAGPPDWEPSFDQHGHDRGARNFGSFLSTHTRRLRHPDLRIDIASRLWAEWTGTAAENGTRALADLMDRLPDMDDPPTARSLHSALSSAATREILARVLIEASPRLSAPIYIGIAGNLRSRLMAHVDTFMRVRAQLANGEAVPERLISTFGCRAAHAELRPDDLCVATMPVEGLADLDATEARSVVAAAEFVLNRWHHPMFGVR